ncbi:MAG: ABC transporter substrate-binding protein [Verrucomicrobia bacterium]|nr:ABC transporter substrate-binding protein [Verrucomicrobiota bacterium]
MKIIPDFFSVRRNLLLLGMLPILLGLAGCKPVVSPPPGRIVIRYWDKWSGFEAEAMRAVVDDFNASQNRIWVDFSSVSQINRKLMLAIGGGVPPDVAGLFGNTLAVYAENNALTPLDRLAQENGVSQERYIQVFWNICHHLGHLWALPSSPASLGLVWNKKVFRENGLDPEHAPTSIEELEKINDRLVRRDKQGRLVSVGHLPSEPGWWPAIWGWWFGGDLWDGHHITADSPANLKAMEWIASYPKRFEARELLSFRDGFGNFASPQNAFFTGRIAIILQGPWIHTFIQKFAPPDFEWGVAAFPSADPKRLSGVTLVETDVLVIPAGASHPREAFEFIQYVNTLKPMEKLCLGQRKFSPLREVSADFFSRHPNPHIRTFLELAQGPQARSVPPITIWALYENDMKQAFGKVWTGATTPVAALHEVQVHLEQEFTQRQRRWDRLADVLQQKWREE